MISYYIQLIICLFMFGFGFGSAIYALLFVSETSIKNAVRKILREERNNQNNLR